MINSRRGSAGAMCWAVTAPVPSSKGESESGYSVTHCLSVSKFIMRACEPYLPSQPTEGWYTAGKVIPKTGLSEHKKKTCSLRFLPVSRNNVARRADFTTVISKLMCFWLL